MEDPLDVRLAADPNRVALEPRSVARESSNRGSIGTATTESVSTADRPGAASSGQDAQASEASRANQFGQFYVSPFLTFDARSLTVIFQVRDTESGDVTRQFPAEAAVERYRRDPSARPFVLPEPSTPAEEQNGPPPPTIGGPVAAAASEAEENAAATAGGGAPTGTGGTADESDAQPSSTPSRPSVDLVA